MAVLGVHSGVASSVLSFRTHSTNRPPRFRISCIGWDPEGILGPPRGGHIARLELKRRLEKDAGAREEFTRHVLEEQERRRARRQARVPPETSEGIVEYFLDTEASDIEFEIARLRPRLTEDFFNHLKIELAKLRFAVSRTTELEDRLTELEAMQKVLLEGTEAYDRMEDDLVLAKGRLMKILQSKDRNCTLLGMVERNELSRSVLALLDENIANALKTDQQLAPTAVELNNSLYAFGGHGRHVYLKVSKTWGLEMMAGMRATISAAESWASAPAMTSKTPSSMAALSVMGRTEKLVSCIAQRHASSSWAAAAAAAEMESIPGRRSRSRMMR